MNTLRPSRAGRVRRWRGGGVALLAALSLLVIGDTASAGRYATSLSPHWQVGQPSEPLSAACRRHRFNQIRDQRTFIGYRGRRGTGVTGVARRGWNLRDRAGLAEEGLTYHFADDGLSTCRVFVAGKAIAKPPPATTQ